MIQNTNLQLNRLITRVNNLKPREYPLNMVYGNRKIISIYFTNSPTDKVKIESYDELIPTTREIKFYELTLKDQFNIYCTLYTRHVIP